MKKRISIIISGCLVLVFLLAGCGTKSANEMLEEMSDEIEQGVEKIEALEESVKEAQETTVEAETTDNNATDGNAVSCGEVFQKGDLSFNVIGVRKTEYDDGATFLVLNMEIYNAGAESVSFTPMDSMTLFGEGGTEYMVDIFTKVKSALGGDILANSKIMGEVAFDISDNQDESYVLHIGEFYDNYQPAIKVTPQDMDQTFEEQFEGGEVTSDYTIGTPVESDVFTVTLNSANMQASDKEGLELVVCEFTVTNNTSETQSFMMGMQLKEVCSADGTPLDFHIDYNVPMSIDGGATVTGKAPYYVPDGKRDFYVVLIPDVNQFNDHKVIAFSAE